MRTLETIEQKEKVELEEKSYNEPFVGRLFKYSVQNR